MSIYDIFQSFSWHRRCIALIVIILLVSFTEFPITVPFVVVKWCLDCNISSQVATPVTGQGLSSAFISSGIQHCQSCLGAKRVTFDILLAEDNLVNQKLAVKILEKYGHTVEIAENGSLAVDAFKGRVAQNKPFEIILVR